MKLKYYLRGMGIGIIVTTIILAVSFSHREVEISDEEVMARAAVLGMVMQKEDAETDVNTDTDVDAGGDVSTESDMNTEADMDTESALQDDVAETDEPEADTQISEVNDTYRLVIQKGDVCRVVCESLAENGVIDDAEALREYLFKLGYANSISTGAYDIPYGLTMEEVAQIIMAGPLE